MKEVVTVGQNLFTRHSSSVLLPYMYIQGDSLTRGPQLLSIKIFNEFVNQLMDDELTTFLKTELSQKTFGHPDLLI